MLVGDADVVVRPCFGGVEEWRELGNQVHSGCLVGGLADEHTTLLALEGVERWSGGDCWATLIAWGTERGLRVEDRMIRCLTTQTWSCMRCHCRRLSVREATAWSVVGRWWLTIHLAKRTARRSKTLRSAIMRFRSVLRSRNLITLDLNRLLRFDQVVVQFLKCQTLRVNLVVQVTNVLKQKLFLRLHLSESCLVLCEIIMHVCVCLMQV